ncbi:NUDIX domain-containing protein [Salinibacter ruber]|uniref:NUDIX domain-containing protein n=1 Tax=Salinibacter ruber TaxID=146919 RepID=UPI0021670398|nr:NUDIX domain-containing protein [Salinibacter ruber]MCS4198103.1 8-oxo-dGTP pyrophosphatase MutT (NUDIX family) [Salinibacter ruber]
MVRKLLRLYAWLVYRLIRASWWIRRPIILGVRVLIADEDRVLLIKHSYRDGWFLPGGTPEAGESLDATARREAAEETGAAIQDVTLLGIYSTLSGPESDHVAVFVGETQNPNSVPEVRTSVRSGFHAEVEEIQWAPVTHLPEGVSEQTQLVLHDWERERTSVYQVVDERIDFC